jgi:hypothetical protein
MTRFTLAVAVAMALAGCASQNRFLVDESTSPHVEQAASAPVTANEYVPGARPIGLGAGGPVSGPRAYNSDNKPTSTRTGLGSDPDNPNGVAQ